MAPQLISEEYARLNADLHQQSSYGAFGHRWQDPISRFVQEKRLSSVLDYGCGKGTLVSALNNAGISARGYDPALPAFSAPPEAADLVVCADVLEHVEPESLDAVLDHLQSLTKQYAFLVISTRPARKTLADGRNAHLTVQPCSWWLPRLWSRWELRQVAISTFIDPDDEFVAVLKSGR